MFHVGIFWYLKVKIKHRTNHKMGLLIFPKDTRDSAHTFLGGTHQSYRLIDLENTEIGGRCISTGPSPLDLGIGAMA